MGKGKATEEGGQDGGKKGKKKASGKNGEEQKLEMDKKLKIIGEKLTMIEIREEWRNELKEMKQWVAKEIEDANGEIKREVRSIMEEIKKGLDEIKQNIREGEKVIKRAIEKEREKSRDIQVKEEKEYFRAVKMGLIETLMDEETDSDEEEESEKETEEEETESEKENGNDDRSVDGNEPKKGKKERETEEMKKGQKSMKAEQADKAEESEMKGREKWTRVARKPKRLSKEEDEKEQEERKKRKCNCIINGRRIKECKNREEIQRKMEKELEVRINVEKKGEVVLIKFDSLGEKLGTMEMIKEKMGEDLWINDDLTQREREVQRWLRKVMEEERDKGKKAYVKYQKLVIDGEEWKWNEQAGDLENQQEEEGLEEKGGPTTQSASWA